LLPLGYIVFIGTALFFATLALAELIAIGEEAPCDPRPHVVAERILAPSRYTSLA
jgi:hypothetical protein